MVTDANGFFSVPFTTTSSGTFTITASYADINTTYSGTIDLTVNAPAAPVPVPPVGPGGGGGGGGGQTLQSELEIDNIAVFVGDSVTASVWCQWNGGCSLKIDNQTVAEFPKTTVFRDFTTSFGTEGTRTYSLYRILSPGNESLVTELQVSVSQAPQPEETAPEQPSENNQPSSGPNTGNTGEENAGATAAEQPEAAATGPTGFFGLGDIDFSNPGTAVPIVLLVLIVLGGIAFVLTRPKN